MIRRLKNIVFNNWHLKIFSMVLATALWITLAKEPTSEIGIDVPLEYQNLPANTEVVSDNVNTVEVRLRGPSTLLKEISSRDVSTTIDLREMTRGGEKVVPLTGQHVRAPFGIEVVRVIPSRVRVILETTVSRRLTIVPRIGGAPAKGFDVGKITVIPDSVIVEGPASRVRQLENIPTTPIDVTGKREAISQNVDLDTSDPLIRIPDAAPVRVEIKILPPSPGPKIP